MKPQERGLWLAPGVDLELGRSWQREFKTWFEAPTSGLPSANSGRLALVDSSLGKLVAKRDPRRPWKDWLSWSGLRAAHGERAFRTGCAMRQAGVPSVEPLAYVQTRGSAPELDGALICRYLEAPDPWAYLAEQDNPEAALGGLIQALVASIAQLHAAGFRHRDLKAPNLLLEHAQAEAAPRILFLDLEAAAGPMRTGTKVVTRDLARLCASFQAPRAIDLGVADVHWELLLSAYLKQTKRSPTEFGPLLRETRIWAMEHNARNISRKRPLS